MELQPYEPTDLELIRKYEDLRQKKKAGKFSYTSAILLSAICGKLKTRGFVMTDDESTWVIKI